MQLCSLGGSVALLEEGQRSVSRTGSGEYYQPGAACDAQLEKRIAMTGSRELGTWAARQDPRICMADAPRTTSTDERCIDADSWCCGLLRSDERGAGALARGLPLVLDRGPN